MTCYKFDTYAVRIGISDKIVHTDTCYTVYSGMYPATMGDLYAIKADKLDGQYCANCGQALFGPNN